MNKSHILLSIKLLISSCSLFSGNDEKASNVIKDIDGNEYPTVRIGTQVWMASNLKTTRYRDGSTIPNVTNATSWAGLTTGAWVNYDNNAANDAIYGKLYNWYAVADSRNICPTGWHVPTDVEWLTLSNYLGADAGFTMKSTTGWLNSGSGSNNSGFSGLPGGGTGVDGTFGDLGSYAYFWSSTQNSASHAWSHYLSAGNRRLIKFSSDKLQATSIRCLQD